MEERRNRSGTRNFNQLTYRDRDESEVNRSRESDREQSDSGPIRKRANFHGFRKNPELDTFFKKGYWNENGQRVVSCVGCGKEVISNRIHRFFEHVRCCKSLPEEMRSNIENIAGSSKNSIINNDRNVKLTRMIIENNLPMKMVESRSFREFTQSLCRDFISSSRREISSVHIAKLADDIKSKFQRKLIQDQDSYLSIEFDHWKDLSGRAILGVVATRQDGTRYLFDLEDVSSVGHGTDAILATLLKCLSQIDPKMINCIISDSASACRAARARLVARQEYAHIIEHRCLAHLFNLIGNEMSKLEPVQTLILTAIELSGYLSNDSAFLSKLKDDGICRIKTYTRTRWYSTVEMLETLVNIRQQAYEHLQVSERRDRLRAARHLATLNDDDFWNDINLCLKFYKPLAHCIAVAERADGCVGEAVKSLLDYANFLFQENWSCEFAMAAVKAFLKYFNKDKLGEGQLGIMLTAYFLDRRYKMDFITRAGAALVLKTLCQIAKASGCKREVIELILYSEFEQYCNQEGEFSRLANQFERAHDWWTKRNSDRGILRRLALRFANLKSSSANIERCFSVIRLTQGVVRANYNLSTLTSLGRAKIFMLDDEYDRDADEVLKNSKLDDENLTCDRLMLFSLEEDELHEVPRSAYIRSNVDTFNRLDSQETFHHMRFKDLIDFSKVNIFKEDLDPTRPDVDFNFCIDNVVSRFMANDPNLSFIAQQTEFDDSMSFRSQGSICHASPHQSQQVIENQVNQAFQGFQGSQENRVDPTSQPQCIDSSSQIINDISFSSTSSASTPDRRRS